MFNQYVLNPLLNTIKNNYKSNALYINEVYYTYHEFAGAISKIRSALQKEDILNKNIGLVANDDLETYASIFAIWMEGYA